MIDSMVVFGVMLKKHTFQSIWCHKPEDHHRGHRLLFFIRKYAINILQVRLDKMLFNFIEWGREICYKTAYDEAYRVK